MKTIIAIALLMASVSTSFSQNPAYNLVAKNFTLGDSLTLHDMIKFDIYLIHTNAPTVFEYAGGQYMFNFNTGISTTGLEFKIVGNTDLPASMAPRGPQVSGSQLRLAVGTFPGPGNGFLMTGNGPNGNLICQVRLRNVGAPFVNVPLNLQWRNAPESNPVTKIFAYVGGSTAEITTPSTHSIEGGNVLNGISLDVRVLIEGLYNNLFNLMNRKDNVKVYLADFNSPNAIVDSASAVIDSITFTGRFNFMNAPSGIYFLKVKHFNTLETWSKPGGISLTQGGLYSYDFTTSAAQAFGDNLKLKGNKYCMWSGDVNQDGIIDGTDLSSIDNLAYNFTAGADIPEDLNGDSIVDGIDFLIGDNNRTYHYVIAP
ncbi:MAG: hypothetical protein K1X85_12090 [Ignavibacteria bacterium]|nr:hypothetical protein [Ignavibacteria bacterium]